MKKLAHKLCLTETTKKTLLPTLLFKRNIWLVALVLIKAAFINAQIQPVTLTTSIKSPYPVFLYDYASDATKALSVVSVFNDFNEPGWDVYFKVSIESSTLKIQTNPDFIPAGPVHLVPGIATTVSGEEFAASLNYNNLIYQGITKSEFISSGGRLPTGFYTFCVEAYDFVSKKKISNSACVSAYIQLNSAPVIVLPQKGGVVMASENQNITFQWQPSSIFSSGSALETEYNISVYEVFTDCKDPDNAIANKQVVKIYESNYQAQTNFNYNLNHPPLEIGKRYAIQVHAQDQQGRNSFENGGYSEASWFYYGYPEGGNIVLKYPENEKAFSSSDFRIFTWDSPDNLLDNQPLFYKIKIVKTNGQEPNQAIVDQPAWYEKTTLESTNHSSGAIDVPAIDAIDEYAWQVSAHTGEQNIANSPVQTFDGPPLLEKFWVGNHIVYVTKTDNRDLNNLSGKGKVKISNGGELFDISFTNISLYNRAGEWYLKTGEIKSALDATPIELKPAHGPNDKALFHTDSIRIGYSKTYSGYVMFLKGHFEWDLPLAVDSVAKGIVKSETKWIYYDTYKLIGTLQLAKGNNFKLMDPLNYMLALSEKSKITIGNNNTYSLELDGEVYLPYSIKDGKKKRVKVPFFKATNLFYLKTSQLKSEQAILLVANSKIFLSPVDYIIDFSDEESPSKLISDREWKGVYFEKYNLVHEPIIDLSNQLKLEETIVDSVDVANNPEFIAWAKPDGLDLYYQGNFDNNPAYFNTFPSELSSLKLKIEANYVSESYFKGTILIPVISETTKYAYTIPVADNGFQTAYLDTDLTNTVFSFNPDGGQQKINLTIKRAVFLYNEKLQMTVDVDWPELDTKLSAVGGFCIWGNYAIGFFNPNSTINLTDQTTGKLNDFDVTLVTLGCGSSEGAYGIGSNMQVVMAENISGSDGPPNMNIYSVCANPFAPKVEEGNINIMDQTNVQQVLDSLNTVIEEYNNIQEQINNLPNSSDEINSLIASALANSSIDYDGMPINTDSLDTGNEVSWSDIEDIEYSIQEIIKVLNALKAFCKPEQTEKIDRVLEFIDVMQKKEVKELYEALTDLRGFTKKLLKQKLDEILNKATKWINEKTAKLNKAYTDKIDNLLAKSDEFVNTVIDSTMNIVSTAVINLTKNDKIDVEPIIRFSTEVTASALKNEINESVRNSAYKNVVDPVTTFVSERFGTSINNFIINEVGALGHKIIDKEGDVELTIDFEKAFTDIRDSIASDISDIDLEATVLNLVNDAITGITVEGLVDKMLEEVVAKLTEPVHAMGVVANTALNNWAEGSGDLASSVLANVELDFSNVGDKIRNGEWDKIVKFDPSHIHVKTKNVEFDAYVKLLKDDPVWGNCFKADVMAKVTLDFEFSANATFINGKVNDYNYWFVELGAHALNVPMTPIPFSLEGADGRIFHHMNYNGTDYLPDNATRLGLALQLYLFDTPSNGSIIKFDVTAEALLKDNGFILEMRGNADIGNVNSYSLANANGYMRINSIEKHLVGNMSFNTNTSPLLCMSGEMGVDIKGINDWNIYVGKRATPNYIKLLCSSNFSIQSWLDIYNSHIDIGLKKRIAVAGQTPWIFNKVRFYADMGYDFEASALVHWQPKFAIDEAMIAISLWADVGADWKNVLGNVKRYSLVDIHLHGLLAFKSVPETNLKGELGGHAKVCGLGVGFDLGIDHTF